MTRVHLAEESSFRKKGRRRCRKVLPATSDPPWSKILKQVTKLSRNDFISYVIKFTKLFQRYRYFLPKKNDISFENPQMKWTWDPNILNDCPETTSQFVPLSQAWFDRNSYTYTCTKMCPLHNEATLKLQFAFKFLMLQNFTEVLFSAELRSIITNIYVEMKLVIKSDIKLFTKLTKI